jgi:hypothetical protein
MLIQSNLSIKTTQGKTQKWSLKAGGLCLQVVSITGLTVIQIIVQMTIFTIHVPAHVLHSMYVVVFKVDQNSVLKKINFNQIFKSAQ